MIAKLLCVAVVIEVAASLFSSPVVQNASGSCSKNEWTCLDGSCIALRSRCNGVVDCVDGSDEDVAYCQTNKKPRNGSCKLPEYPAHGTYFTNIANAKPGYAYDLVTINVVCREGFLADGFTSTYCLYGWWQNKMPKCVSRCHLPSHESVEYHCLVSGAVEGSRICNEYEPSGTAVSPRCRTPVYYSATVLRYMRCESGQWDYVAICTPECGTVTPSGTPLVAGGAPAKRGEVTWHAGVYDKEVKPYLQICGGTLISTDVVISAAHCFWSNYLETKLPARRYAAAVGKLYRAWGDTVDVKQGAQRSDVKEIHLPARFQGNAANFQDDIAVLIVTDPFKYTTFIRPVCLDFGIDFERRQLQPGNTGKVAGWGLVGPHSKESLYLQIIDLPYISIETCISESLPSFRALITSDKICAGFKDAGKAICKGDSGGGLAFPEPSKGIQRYYLRGIVSTAPQSDSYALCNVNNYTSFTRVQSHEYFIKQFLVAAGYQPHREHGTKDEDPEVKENQQPHYGPVHNTTTKFPPRFKHPKKMFHYKMKRAGSFIKLSCAAEGNPTLNITWYKDEVTPIDRSNFQPSYGKWSLGLKELTETDSGNYTCVVCNKLDCIEHTVVLHVQAFPETEAADNDGQNSSVYVVTALLGAMFIAIAVISWRFKWENTKIVTYPIKTVTVEKPAMYEEGLLLTPVIKIREKQRLLIGQRNTMMMPKYELSVDNEWEVSRESLILGKVLRDGEFGKLVKGECVGFLKPRMQRVVAVKMLKEDHTDAEMMKLVNEMEMMKMIGQHDNIINLLGCCSQAGPLCVIVTYAPDLHLRKFLRNYVYNCSKSSRYHLKEKRVLYLINRNLVSFSKQVASGMEYLASRGCVHRDLAARNVLVCDDWVLKIAGFSLVKNVHSDVYCREKTKSKLRWMAPESLSRKIFTTQSDVWSFGVLLWEIMTLGEIPYAEVESFSLKSMYQHLNSGGSLEKPRRCTREIYMLMSKCWLFSPRDRPSFTELVGDLDNILAVSDEPGCWMRLPPMRRRAVVTAAHGRTNLPSLPPARRRAAEPAVTLAIEHE